MEKYLTAFVKHLSAGFMFAAGKLFATAVPFETRYCFADGKHLLLNDVCFSIFLLRELCLLQKNACCGDRLQQQGYSFLQQGTYSAREKTFAAAT